MSAAAEIARALSGFTDRGVGTDAERRAATWLTDEVNRTGRRGARLETFWCRPNWAMAQAWHVGLGLAGSLVSASDPWVGAGLLAGALVFVLADAIFGVSPGRRLTPEHASQNVVSLGPTEASTPPVSLIISANLDAGRRGLAYRPALRHPFARLRAATGGVVPGWAGWLAIAIGLVLITAILRAGGDHGTPIKVLQLVPTAGLVIALALLLELAGQAWSPGAGDNASGVGVAVALTRALDAAPPAHASVQLVLTGAGDSQDLGLRRYLRAHRDHRAQNSVVLGIGPIGSGSLACLRSDGPLFPLGYSGTLRRLCRELGDGDPSPHLPELRSRGVSPGLAARQAGLPALAIGARDALGLAPLSHTSSDTPENLDEDLMDRALYAILALVDAIDAYLGEVRPA